MIFADSGWLIALIRTRDALHERAEAWLGVVDEPILTTRFVIAESFNTLSHPSLRRVAHRYVDRLIGADIVRITSNPADEFRAGVELHRIRPDQAWSLTDCISFSVMTRLGIHMALAHDKHFIQAGFDALLKRDPG